jgi:hypothetical protein
VGPRTNGRPGDKQREQTLRRQRFDPWRQATEHFVRKLSELRSCVIERLESAPHPVNNQSKTMAGRPRKTRRARQPAIRPLTSKETQAVHLVGEHKGNISADAKVVGITRQAMEKR